MEIILGICVLLFALFLVVHSLTELVKQLKTGKPTRLSKGFSATLSVIPVDNKNEVSSDNTNSKKDDE